MTMFNANYVELVKKQNKSCSFSGLAPRQLIYVTFKSKEDLYDYHGLSYGSSGSLIEFIKNNKIFMVHDVSENRLSLTLEHASEENKLIYSFGQHDIVSILPVEAGSEDLIYEENGILTIGGLLLSDEEVLGVFKTLGSHIARRRDNGTIQSNSKERSSS